MTAIRLIVTALVAWVALASSTAYALRPFGAGGGELQGKFRALVVWVQDYEHWTKLSAPKKDAERVVKALTEKYLFAREDVEVLGNPTQSELFKAVKSIATKARAGDSVLIVFAGHGFLETASGQGYWVPRDAKRPGDAAELTYLSSAWVRDVLKGSEALHVAVVSDSCFSGALLSSRGGEAAALSGDAYYAKLYQRRSFEGLTSGALETVDDTGAPGGHSPFAYYLALALESPDTQVFDLQDVFVRIRNGVKSISRQTPLYGRLAGAPSDGGGFVFVARDGVAKGVAPTPVDGGVVAGRTTRSDEPVAEPTPAPVASSGPSEAIVKAWNDVRVAIGNGRFDEAVRIGLKARFCEAAFFEGCAMLAEAYEEGHGTVADPARALDLYTIANGLAGPACERSEEVACYILGDSLVLGRGVGADKARGAKLLRQACDLGHGEACGALATHIEDKKVSGSAADSVKLWEKGCRTGDPTSCFSAGRAYERGAGVKADDKRAGELYNEGCDGGFRTACGALGVLLFDGRGVAKDLDQAGDRGAFGCEAKDALSCAVLAAVLFVGNSKLAADPARSLQLFQESCDGGYRDACYGAGQILWAGGQNESEASRPEEARVWLAKGCDKDDAASCDLLGQLVDGGHGGDWDMSEAQRLFKKACKLGHREACER